MRSPREKMYSENRGEPKVKTWRTNTIQGEARKESLREVGACLGLYIFGTVGLSRKPQSQSFLLGIL